MGKTKTRTPEQIARAEEMKRLHFEEHLTLAEIGRRYEISRERVRQIIGNSGRWNEEQGKFIPHFYKAR